MLHTTKTNTAPKAIPTIAPVDIFDDDEGGDGDGGEVKVEGSALEFAVGDGAAVVGGDGDEVEDGESSGDAAGVGGGGGDVAGVVGGVGGEYDEYGAAAGLPAGAFDIIEN